MSKARSGTGPTRSQLAGEHGEDRPFDARSLAGLGITQRWTAPEDLARVPLLFGEFRAFKTRAQPAF